jgi:hypothetical protein
MSTALATASRPTRHRPRWALVAAVAVLVLGGLGSLLPGLALVVADLAERGEMFDGLGVVLGLALAVLGLLLLVVAGTACVFMRRRPVQVAAALTAVGLVLALGGFALAATTGVLVAAPIALGGLLVSGLSLTEALGSPW